MIKPLLWKEWHEQSWKILFGTVMLVFFTGSLLAAGITSSQENLLAFWLLGGLVLSLYSAMGTFAPEITDGTKMFLASKPVEPWKTFSAKWFSGWLNFAVPMIICSLVLASFSLLNQEARFNSSVNIIRGTFVGIYMGTVFYSLTCCLAPRKGGEALVGFTGCIIFFLILLHMEISQFVINASAYSNGFSFSQQLFMFINPLSLLNIMVPISGNRYPYLIIIEQGILFAFTLWIGFRKWQRTI
jgi:hypothetical protein